MTEKLFSEPDKRRLIGSYYEKFPFGFLFTALISLTASCAILIMGGQDMKIYGAAFGFVFLLACSYVIYYLSKGKAADKNIDEWLMLDIEAVKKRAFSKLGTDDKTLIKEPVVIFKPVYWKSINVRPDDLKMKRGKDNIYRFTIWDILVFHLMPDYFGCYKTTMNTIKGKIINESTRDIYYQDVVSVGMENVLIQYIDSKIPVSTETLMFKAANGDSITIEDITIGMKKENKNTLRTPFLEQIIVDFRAILKEKKGTVNEKNMP